MCALHVLDGLQSLFCLLPFRLDLLLLLLNLQMHNHTLVTQHLDGSGSAQA